MKVSTVHLKEPARMFSINLYSLYYKMSAKRCHKFLPPKFIYFFSIWGKIQSSPRKRQNHILWRLCKVIGIFNNVFVQLTFVFIDLLISSLFVQEIYFILFVTCYVNKNDYLVKLEWKRMHSGTGLLDRIQIFWKNECF